MDDSTRPGLGRHLRDALLDALAIVLPVECSGCGTPDRAVCDGCRAELSARPLTVTTPGGLEVLSALAYERRVRSIVLAFKEQGRTDAARHLAGPLAAAITEAVHGPCELIAVPTSRAAWRRRGYDPVRMLLRRSGLDPGRPHLVAVRRTGRQKALDREHRASNVSGALRARHPLSGRRFLIVDDVVTTGVTLDEAARAIRAAGGEVIGAATLAATPLRHPGASSRRPGVSDQERGDRHPVASDGERGDRHPGTSDRERGDRHPVASDGERADRHAGASLRRHVDRHPRSLGNGPATPRPP